MKRRKSCWYIAVDCWQVACWILLAHYVTNLNQVLKLEFPKTWLQIFRIDLHGKQVSFACMNFYLLLLLEVKHGFTLEHLLHML